MSVIKSMCGAVVLVVLLVGLLHLATVKAWLPLPVILTN